MGFSPYIPPEDRPLQTCIGVGGHGADNVNACAASENIVALCDVDASRAARTFRN